MSSKGRDTIERFLYITWPLWCPAYLVWEDEDLELVAASILVAPWVFLGGLVLHGGSVVLNLIEAVKSGRSWKEKGGQHVWTKLVKSAHLGLAMEDELGNQTQVVPHFLTEKEWEIVELEVRVTRSQFWEASSEASREWVKSPGFSLDALLERVARLLGLEGE